MGVPVPPGVPAQVATITDALPQLLSRWARSRGPFVLGDAAAAFGLSVSAAHQSLSAIDSLVEGHYRQGIDETEYVSAGVLKVIRGRCLARVREATEPVSASAFGRFLPDWQQLAPAGSAPQLRGVDGTFSVIEQLAGVRLPASAWESLVLPGRVGDYSPRFLDELTANGEVFIVGAGKAGNSDPWIMLLPAGFAEQLAPQVDRAGLGALEESIVQVLSRGGGFLFSDLLAECSGDDLGVASGQVTAEQLREALWGLVETGVVSPGSFAGIRQRLAGKGTAHRAKRRPQRSRLRMGRTSFAQTQRAQTMPPDMAGRWVLSVPASHDATARSVALGEAWLDRYGVVTRGSVVAEDTVGGFALAYKALSGFEESGKAMRGYLIDGLGAAQFSTPSIIDRLRGNSDSPDTAGWPSGTTEPAAYVLAACDPANPYGAALPWPGAGASRAAGALVVLIDGLCVAHLTRGGKTLTTFLDSLPEGIDHEEAISLVYQSLVELISAGRLSSLVVEKINGQPAFDSPLLNYLRSAGATVTPKGLRLASRPTAPRSRQRGRNITEAMEDISFDDRDIPTNYSGGFRPSGGHRR